MERGRGRGGERRGREEEGELSFFHRGLWRNWKRKFLLLFFLRSIFASGLLESGKRQRRRHFFAISVKRRLGRIEKKMLDLPQLSLEKAFFHLHRKRVSFCKKFVSFLKGLFCSGRGKGKLTWPFSAQRWQISAFRSPACWLYPLKPGGEQKSADVWQKHIR
jgi:hypothetical protein